MPVVAASHNGLKAADTAMQYLLKGIDALDAVLHGVDVVEDDGSDHSVGYGGLPNADGVVELEASCMHGPTHRCGAVAGLRDIRYPARVARAVMEHTPHSLLVGNYAEAFAVRQGFSLENLLSPEAEKIFEYWKAYQSGLLSRGDLENLDLPRRMWDYFGITGTLTCLAVDENHGISGVTTTSGVAFKQPGRVGDSSIIGAGLYVENRTGACGSIGLGEENLRNLNCFKTVQYLKRGMTPEDACRQVLGEHLESEMEYRPFDSQSGPGYNITLIAVSKSGETGAAALYGPRNYAVNDGKSSSLKKAAYIFEKREN